MALALVPEVMVPPRSDWLTVSAGPFCGLPPPAAHDSIPKDLPEGVLKGLLEGVRGCVGVWGSVCVGGVGVDGRR